MNAEEKMLNTDEEHEHLEEELEEAHEHEHDLEEEIEECDNVIVDLETERDEWKEKAYRLAAEMENIKKRNQKELSDTRKYAITNIAKELVDVKDNLDRALEVMKNGNEASTEDAIKAMLDGIQMVESQLETSCNKLNITKIESLGKKFDPDFHQVMMEVEDEKAESGVIVQEMQAGYMIGDRLLRPAMVGTAK
jgi:molecular chaperone GrpE